MSSRQTPYTSHSASVTDAEVVSFSDFGFPAKHAATVETMTFTVSGNPIMYRYGIEDAGAFTVGHYAEVGRTLVLHGNKNIRSFGAIATTGTADLYIELATENIASTVEDAPAADFSTEVTDLEVQFTNETSSFGNTYLWDFGDETSSTAENPLHEYAGVGTYYVVLTATNRGGVSKAIEPVEITTIPVENTVAPSISGTMTVGQTLTVSLGTWTGVTALAGSLRYVSDDTEVATFTADGTYLLDDADFDQSLYLYVVPDGNAAAAVASAAVGPVNVDADFAAMSDGALPSYLTGSTWDIVSGVAVNTPSTGANLLTDPGLEGTYTAGKVAALQSFGSPTLAQSADVHGGSKAQQFQATISNDIIRWANLTGETHQWYRFRVWGKRLSGTADAVRAAITTTRGTAIDWWTRPITSAAYALYGAAANTYASTVLGNKAARQTGTTTFEEVVVDDGEMVKLTHADLFALTETGHADVVLKVRVALDPNASGGLVVRANDLTNPTSFILFHWHTIGPGTYGILDKVVNGVYTPMAALDTIVLTGVPNGAEWLELRVSGTAVSCWYAGTRLVADQTISDTEIVDNTIHGLFDTGGAAAKRLFMAAQLEAFNFSSAGSSITEPVGSYSNRAHVYMRQENPHLDIAFHNAGVSGHPTFANAVRLSADVLAYAPDLLVFENRPDTAWEQACFEAYIRRVWNAYPNCRIIWINFQGVTDHTVNDSINSPVNQAGVDAIRPMLAAYGIPEVDYTAEIQRLVNEEGHDLTEYYNDTIHPTTTGQQVAFELLQSLLPNGGGAMPAEMPARMLDNGDFENDPVRLDATEYDSRSGTWTDDGTDTSSSTDGDTITFSAVCQAFGLYGLAGGTGTIDYSIDGGAYVLNQAVGPRGVSIPPRGLHTVTIRIRSGNPITLYQFWAI